MKYADNILELVGNTPMLRLGKIAAGLRPTILAKLEFLNPGGSVKDRIGLAMIEEAERQGRLKPGGMIVEPTSGNTGVGLAMAAAIKGYRCTFVMPDKMSMEKVRLLKAYGADVVITPTAVPKESPDSYYSVAERLARDLPGGFQPNQYANFMNPRSHYDTTGPEIWEQTDGRVDVFVCGLGTGGTITGVAQYLKEKKPSVRIVGVDPEGSLYTNDAAWPYKTEGVGEDFIPATIDLSLVDEYVTVSDRESFVTARHLAREEGILAGGSSGMAVFAALKVARHLDDDRVVVVLLPDTGRNYLSKFFADDYMKEHGFWDEDAESATVEQVLRTKNADMPSIITASCREPVMRAIEIMRTHSISQVPVLNEANLMVGTVHETELMNLIFEDPKVLQQNVEEVMSEALPSYDRRSPISSVYKVLLQGRAAVVVTDAEQRPQGILTKIDLIDFFSRSKSRR